MHVKRFFTDIEYIWITNNLNVTILWHIVKELEREEADQKLLDENFGERPIDK